MTQDSSRNPVPVMNGRQTQAPKVPEMVSQSDCYPGAASRDLSGPKYAMVGVIGSARSASFCCNRALPPGIAPICDSQIDLSFRSANRCLNIDGNILVISSFSNTST